MCKEEGIRHREYCQLRRDIRGSKEHLIVGIDIAKKTHYAFFGTAAGKTLRKRLIFKNTHQGFKELVEYAGSLQARHQLPKVVFGLEPTGNYHKPLGSYLIENGHHLVLVSGEAAKNNRKLLDGRWDKHDTKCAANIADLISQGKCMFYEKPSLQIQELRDLLSLRRRFKREEHRIKMRIRNSLIAKHFPELDQYYESCEAEGLAILRWCHDPRQIAGMEYEQFYQMVTSGKKGLAQEKRLRAIHKEAGQTIGLDVARSSEYEARILVESLHQSRKAIKEIEGLMHEVSLFFPEYKYILTIPGFGPYISAVVLARIGDPHRFQNTSQLIKLSGYDLCAERSGQNSNQAIPVISKKGTSELRYALYQAALVATSFNPDFKKYFHEKLSGRELERGIKTKMRVKVATKMLVIAWTLMKKKEPFNPEHLFINMENLPSHSCQPNEDERGRS